MKKIICLAVLAAVFALSVCAANIGTADEFVTLMETESMWSGDYVLTDTINLDGYKLSPIGTKDVPFTGTFDGAGYEIKNINLSGDTYVALFGYIKGATITDLTISGTVTATGDYSGGLVAYASGEMYISKCHNKCNVTGIEYTGGICGYATGSDKSTTVAKMNITECMNSGTITCLDTAQSDAGGIAGSIYGVGNVSDCFNVGLVTTGDVSLDKPYIGGIVGKTGSYGRVTNCYNTVAPITPSEATTYVRAIVGRPNVKNGANNFFKDGLGMSDKNYGSVYSADKFDTLNANGLWVNAEDPYLAYFYVAPEVPEEPEVPDEPVEPEIPDVTLDSEISTADQLLTLMNYSHLWNADYTLANDIDLSTATLDLAQKPIGSEETPYSGIFDGAGYEISNINLVGETHVALFAYINKATVKNLTVSGTVTANGRFAAGIAAYAGTGAVRIEKCHNKCTVTGLEYTAGIVGYFKGTDSVSSEEPKSVIENCWNSGTINALDETQSDAGGIVGSAWNIGWIKNCLNTGLITTCEVAPPQPYLGGICGKTYSFVRIENCYNAVAPITASASKKYVRGIAGYPSAKNSFNNFYKDGLGMSDAACGEPYSVDNFSLLNVYGAWVDKNEPKLAAFYTCEHAQTDYEVIAPSTCDVKGSAKEFCSVCFAELGTVELPLEANVHTAYIFAYVDGAYKYICEKCDTAVDSVADGISVIPVSVSDNKDGTVTLVLNVKAETPILMAGFEVLASSGATLVDVATDISSDSGFTFVSAEEYANPYRMSVINSTASADTVDANVTLTYAVAQVDTDYTFEIGAPEFYSESGDSEFAVPTSAVVTVADSAVYVAKIGDVKYATLAGAFAAAVEGDTIVALEKITVSGTETWDLTGKTLELAKVEGNYALVVKGNLTINGGNFVANTEFGIGVTGTLTVNGGTFSTDKDYYLIGSWGNTVINGGEFTAVYNNVNCFAGTLAITGGNFTVTGTDEEYPSSDVFAENGGATVTGGTFSTDPSNYVAQGFKAEEADGKYGIVEITVVLGDIDADGFITVKDVMTLLYAVADGIPVENGDVNCDGNLSLIDVIRVLKLATV